MRARLRLVTDQPGAEHAVEVTHSLLIGRAPTSNYVIASSSVSRWHALIRRISAATGEYQIMDLGSQNGTFVDGQRVTVPTRLPGLSILRVGEQRLEFQVFPEASADAAMSGAGEAVMVTETVVTLVCDVRRPSGGDTPFATPVAWFRKVAAVIAESGGVLERFVGDQVLAYWAHSGVVVTMTPEEAAAMSGHSECGGALAAARRLSVEAATMDAWPDGAPFRVGIALHTGAAGFDRGGSIAKPAPALVGPVVEETHRLEAISRSFIARMVCSEALIPLLPGDITPEQVGVAVLHKDEPPVAVYRI